MTTESVVLDYLRQLTAADSIEEVWALHVDMMAQYDFDRLLYGFTRYRSGNSLTEEDALILSNHCNTYLERFVGDRLFLNAPMVRWSLENKGACSWSWVDEQIAADALSAKELDVVRFNHKMGVVAGYSFSFNSSSNRSAAGLALTSKRGKSQAETDATWAEHGRDIFTMCQVAHLKITSLPYSGRGRPLTDRQREVLEWVGDGKTMQDVATIMGLTPATVEKHLRLARETLNVDTTTQAVLKASFQNQIFVIGE